MSFENLDNKLFSLLRVNRFFFILKVSIIIFVKYLMLFVTFLGVIEEVVYVIKNNYN